LTQDAFIHLPNLRERVTPPEKSLLRLTPEMFAMWEQRARAAGLPANWRLSDEIIEASRLTLLGEHGNGDDLWIYCYGSLMWDPGFHFAEVRLADVEGYQRRFTLKIELGRGSREHPALMLSLEAQAGCCRGLASSRACSSGPIGTCSSNHGTEVVPGAARVGFGEDAKLNTYSARDGPPEIVEVNLPGRRSVDLRAAGYLNFSIAGGIGAGLDAGGFQDWQIVAIAICA